MSAELLTVDTLERLLDECQWPEPYKLEDELPDGIAMVFPRCTLFWVEGDGIGIEFLSEQTGFEKKLTHQHALRAVRSMLGATAPPAPQLIDDIASLPSPAKFQNNVRDLCTLVLTYLRPTLAGDFTWVEIAKSQYFSS